MKLLKESKYLVEYILPNYNKCLLKQYNNTLYNKKLNNILQILYSDVMISNKKFHTNKKNFNITFKNKKDFNIPNFTSLYMPNNIKEYINNNGIYQINYKFIINNRLININIMLYSSNDLLNIEKYNNWFYNMYLILYICSLYSASECSKILNIYLFPTDYKKELPENKNIIGPINVNTAYTKRCQPNGEIIIYRRQEWFKVFIHECIHSFGLDINLNIEKKINKQLSNIFSLDIDFSISEAYTETWARILNVSVACFNNIKKHKNKEEKFIEQTSFFLQLEKIFSIIQMNKVLNNMNLTYNIISNKNKNNIIICQNLYKQNTHVFGYYVLTAILLNKSMEFMDYCIKNNLSFLKFNQTNTNAIELVKFIKNSYKAKMLTECEKTFTNSNKNNFIKKNMRMSAIEFI
mgnify:CR=1 FL=1|tara:strand:- start:236 stop:1456 length:1221 start_codon:yes stop_codon:yes gene_type:complete